MTDIQQEIAKLKDQQQVVLKHLESEVRAKIDELSELLRMRPKGFEFSDDVGLAFQELDRVRQRMGVREPVMQTESGRKRFGRATKKRFLRNWIVHRDGEFTHRDLCEAFGEMNHGQTTQRTFYLPVLKELIDEGIVEEQRHGEGERPRIVFTRGEGSGEKER